MKRKELMIEVDMLKGNIDRMMVAKNPKELCKMYEVAEYRMRKIYKARVIELKKAEDES